MIKELMSNQPMITRVVVMAAWVAAVEIRMEVIITTTIMVVDMEDQEVNKTTS